MRSTIYTVIAEIVPAEASLQKRAFQIVESIEEAQKSIDRWDPLNKYEKDIVALLEPVTAHILPEHIEAVRRAKTEAELDEALELPRKVLQPLTGFFIAQSQDDNGPLSRALCKKLLSWNTLDPIDSGNDRGWKDSAAYCNDFYKPRSPLLGSEHGGWDPQTRLRAWDSETYSYSCENRPMKLGA